MNINVGWFIAAFAYFIINMWFLRVRSIRSARCLIYFAPALGVYESCDLRCLK